MAMFDAGRMIPVGDAALFVAQAGNPAGPPVVLLHGGLGSRADFARLAAGLQDFRLIAIDSRGHGRSDLGAAQMSYRQMAEDVATVLERLDLTGAGLIGHSDGGIVALWLASGLTRPAFVVTAGAQASLPADHPARAIYADVTAEGWCEMFPAEVAAYEAENPAPDFARLFAATRTMWLGGSYPGAAVGRITCPLLVLHGDEDFLIPRADAVALAGQVLGARLFVLPFAGHTLLQDCPADVLPSLRRFMAEAAK
ncbi:MAG: alpha/beta fold hydrolase [Paracoccus sp. (in: a-proteobacteria)]|uniref:alpha/beta fold hydrolase n=1 Tax=Paracoccus sp. TaxID=267 RepID=UPI0026E0CF8F|nr:alpha/beta fold hydrolase [Paracoccus sp. (in: a-proteobacteria)]MDO5622119.1 alpha/beta fold hydrolase [Paracoccus sp. (in: a-proteobacteria)]